MISIVIPNYNGSDNLPALYKSISEQSFKDYKIIFVDNGSSDNSIGITRKYFPDSEIISLEKNFGFAKAVNDGIKYSLEDLKSEYLLLLNNDIELKMDFLEKGIKTFSDVAEASFIAVKMMNYFNRDFIDDTGNFIKSNGGSPMMRGFREKDAGQYDKPEFIFGACAGAAFYKSEVFIKTGLFDEDFFAYLEDVDLSFRFQLAGFKCYYNPEIVCYHKRGETTKKFSGWETYYTEKNLLALRLKNYPVTTYLKYSPLFFAARFLRFLKFFFRYPPGVFSSAVKGYFRGLSEIPSSLKKRCKIQKTKVASAKYIESLFMH